MKSAQEAAKLDNKLLQFGHGAAAVDDWTSLKSCGARRLRFNSATALPPWMIGYQTDYAVYVHELQFGHGAAAVDEPTR